MEGLVKAVFPVTLLMSRLSMLVWPAYVFSICLFALWVRRRTKATAVATGMWLVYAVYETLMALRLLCSGDCNIRIDLLLIYPALLVASIAAVLSSIRKPPTLR